MNVGESQITQSLKVRDFGVTFDQLLNFDDHITAICRSTYFHIRNIGKIRNLLSYNACSTIIHTPISCHLDYCNSLLYNNTIFNNGRYTTNIPTDPRTVTTTYINTNMCHIHTSIVSQDHGRSVVVAIPARLEDNVK